MRAGVYKNSLHNGDLKAYYPDNWPSSDALDAPTESFHCTADRVGQRDVNKHRMHDNKGCHKSTREKMAKIIVQELVEKTKTATS